MLIYISGPYSADTPDGVQANIEAAEKAAFELLKRTSHIPFIPHTMTAGWEDKMTLEEILTVHFEIVKKCDAIWMIEGWEKSNGAMQELELAKKLGKFIFYNIDEIFPADPYPEQFAMFDSLVQEMSATHRMKNHDYSAQNISASGQYGIISRILDKICRILSLEGWDVEITFKGFREAKKAKFESVYDAYKDLSVYALIALIFKQGKWGK